MEVANEPIAAIATPVGRGAIGIVRISGGDLRAVARRLVGKLPSPRVATCCSVRASDNTTIDNALVIYFAGPRSFTGDDVLEIQTHGGIVITQDVLTAALDAGARLAGPGEFTERAFLNGKIDLLQAEAIADLIDSSSSRAARLAQRSLAGGFSRSVDMITDELKVIRIQLEATIDFPEEGIPPVVVEILCQRSVAVADRISVLLQQATHGAKLNSGLDIAIIGLPNVGKSTLLNLLANEDRAIVTELPGTTRDILSVDINLDGLLLRVHDTAGIRESADQIEQEGVKRAKQKTENSDAVFYVFTESDDELTEFINDLSIPVFAIRNKIDLGNLPALEEKRQNGFYVQISAQLNLGIELLRKGVLEYFSLASESDNVVLARERHLVALREAQTALDFDYAQLYDETPELGAERLRNAANALGVLTGEYTSEDLLGDIFTKFCIGK